MRIKLLLCLSALLLFCEGVFAQPVYRAMRGEVFVSTTPGGYDKYMGSYKYGDTIPNVTGADRNWIRVSFPNGAKGYIGREYLSDSFVETKYRDIPLEQKMTHDLYRTRGVPVTVFSTPEGNERLFDINFGRGYIIDFAEDFNKELLAIPTGGNTKGYIVKSELIKVSEEDKLAYFDPVKATEAKAQAAADRKANMAMFKGMKAGRLAVYIIMGFIGAIFCVSLYRRWKAFDRKLSGGALGFYCVLLALTSMIEIWYLFSLGIKGASWFIHDPSTFLIIVNGILLIVFAMAQLRALFNAVFDLGYDWNVYFNYKWGLWGLLISLILYGAGRYFSILSGSHELLIVLCILLGQIPQAINMWWAAGKSRNNTNRKLVFVIFYLITITGTICLTALMLVALIVGLIACAAMFLLSRGSDSGWDENDEERKRKLDEDLDWIDRTSGSYGEAQARKAERKRVYNEGRHW